ncbi:MAG: hypothetical protein ACKPKO_15790 [Candidatus Fonsibacter sp.]
MKEVRKYAGSYRNTATRWGELVTGDHITCIHDNMLGVEGGKDVFVMKDAYSGLQAAYPMPDKSADSTKMAIQHFKILREIERILDFIQTAPARSNVLFGIFISLQTLANPECHRTTPWRRD